MKSTITTCLALLVILSSCQKENIEKTEPVTPPQVVAPVSKIVYLDYFLEEVTVGGKQKLVVTTTLSQPAPTEIKINYVVYLNTVFTQVKVVVPAGVTSNVYETAPYVSAVPFKINDVFVTCEMSDWTIRFPKP